MLRFEWDEAKCRRNLEKHDVDFAYVTGIFEGRIVTRIDDRDYRGEVRFISIGLVDGACFVVVHTLRNNAIRLISAWKGGRDEQARYQARDDG